MRLPFAATNVDANGKGEGMDRGTHGRLGRRAARLAATVLMPALALVSCAGEPRRDAAARGPEALYAGLEATLAGYREGLQRLREGDVDGGRERMERASAALAAGGNACVSTPGCEPQRFMAAYGNLLSLRSSVLTGDAEGFAGVSPGLQGEARMLSDDVPEAARSVNLLHGHDLAKVIRVNGPVKAALHDWLTWMRPNLVDAWENYAYLRHQMWPAYEKAGLPEALLFGILAKESGGKVHAVSPAGAAGPLQFMYHTGLRFGLNNSSGFDTRYDPAAAAQANVAYLQEQFRHLNNNLEMALAAYNGGEGRMRRLAAQSRGRSFWSAGVFTQLPRETREYVPYVLAAAWLFLHPEDYGLEFPSVDGSPGEVRLAQAMTLGELTICLGQAGSRDGWFRTLRNLNPRVNPERRLPAGASVALPARLVPVYQAQCVDGRMAELAALLQDARQPGGVSNGGGKQYVVRKGDTLASIARRHGCASPEAIARANNIRAPRYTIRPSQELRLPDCTG